MESLSATTGSLTFTDIETSVKCAACDQTFFPFNQYQKYCSRSCQKRSTNHTARAAQRKAAAEEPLEFIGVDGEGITVTYEAGLKEHRYVMLSVGNATLWKGNLGLGWQDIFPFLWAQYLEHPKACFVGFYLGYDFTNWLADLPEERARMLFNPKLRARTKSGNNRVPFPMRIGSWEVDILGLRRFKLRKRVAEGEKPNSWMFINDAGAFFQTSFLKVIDPNPKKWPTGAPCTVEEYETIKTGKNKRADTFHESDISYYPDMVRYNRLENEILARTCSIMDSGFQEDNVKLKKDQFFGPGQVAQQWLTQQSKGKFLLHKDMEALPETLIEAAIASYFGGWFEIFYHGHIPGTSYEYDIASAYPYIMANLPCLCGRWKLWEKRDKQPLQLVFAGVAGEDVAVGAAMFRTPKKHIIRPHLSYGWYWMHEIEAGVKAGVVSVFEPMYGWTYQPCKHEPPLAAMRDMYQHRLSIGKNTPRGKGQKTILNSSYGKFAQSVGSPKFGNPIYASLITSHTRTVILDAIASHPYGTDHLLMVATDGVYFRSEHPTLASVSEGDPELGSWEVSRKENLTLMKPGVYWDDKARSTLNDQELSLKSRGINARALKKQIGRLDDEFTALTNNVTGQFPTIEVSVPFSIVTPQLALARGKWGTCANVAWDTIRFDSAKIEPKRFDAYLDDGLIRSHPMPVTPDQAMSLPYDRRFGFDPEDDPDEDQSVPEEVTQDGGISQAVGSFVTLMQDG